MFVYQMVCHILYPKFQSTVCHILSQLIYVFPWLSSAPKGLATILPPPPEKKKKERRKKYIDMAHCWFRKRKKENILLKPFPLLLFNMITNLSLLELLQNQNRVSLIIFQVKKKNIYYYILTNKIKPQEISLSKNWR